MGSPECEFGRVWLIAGAAVLKVRFGPLQGSSGKLRRHVTSQILSGSIRSP